MRKVRSESPEEVRSWLGKVVGLPGVLGGRCTPR